MKDLTVFSFVPQSGNIYTLSVKCKNSFVCFFYFILLIMLVLLLTLLMHASRPGTWHGHVEAPCCWETLHAGTLLFDWRRPGWVEWTLHIRLEAGGTNLIRPLFHSVLLILFCSTFPPQTLYGHLKTPCLVPLLYIHSMRCVRAVGDIQKDGSDLFSRKLWWIIILWYYTFILRLVKSCPFDQEARCALATDCQE